MMKYTVIANLLCMPKIRDFGPAQASAAPQKPPMRACELEDGRPHHQVTRFHTMAPSRAASTTMGVMTAGSTMPLPMALATWVPKNMATKLKKAAHTTATPGVRTRVDTTVAMELAASWNPLMKSKASA